MNVLWLGRMETILHPGGRSGTMHHGDAEAPSFLWPEEVPKVETLPQWASFTAP